MPISKVTTGSITDSVAIDTDTLVVDGTNNRVGIGTATPNEALTIEAPLSGDTGLAINYSGDNKAGITVNPITGQIQVGAHPDLTSAGGYYLSFNTAASNTVYERMKIDSSGRVTMPYQPAFRAILITSPNTAGNYLVFETVDYNIGNHYNSSTGVFTAPIAGRYMVTVQGFNENNQNSQLYVQVNNTNKSYSLSYAGPSGSNQYNMMSQHTVFNLAANDTVRVICNAGELYAASVDSNSFSCHLLG